jgi:alpha-1,6-mannosyltransferase
MQKEPPMENVSLVPDKAATNVRALHWAGFAGVAVLVLVTSGIPLPAVAVVTLGVTGMGTLVLTWLGIGRHAAELPVRRLYGIAASWCLPLLAARPLFSGDVHSYLAQGVIAAKGFDAYLLGPAAALGADSPVTQQVSHYWQDTPAPYGPAFVTLSRTIAHLAGENLLATVLLHRLVEVAGVVLLAWALPRLAQRVGVSPSVALWLALLNPLVLWHVVGGVHNDGLMVGLMVAGVELVLMGASRAGAARPALIAAGVVVVGVAANVKIVAVAALCFVGVDLFRRARPAGRIAVVLGLPAVFAATTVAISAGSGLGFGWIRALAGVSGQVHSWLAPTNELGFLVGGLGKLGGLDLTDSAIKVFSAIGAILGLLAGARLLWLTYREKLHPLLGAGLAFAAMLVFGPVVQPWYLLWTVALLAVSLTTDRARWILAGVSSVFALLLPPAGGVAALVLGYLFAAVLLVGTLLLLRKKRVALAEKQLQTLAADYPPLLVRSGAGRDE